MVVEMVRPEPLCRGHESGFRFTFLWSLIPMRRRVAVRNKNLGFEPLEQRALMSVAGIKPVHQGVAALLARVDDRKIADSSLGETAILNSLIGGNPGHEFATLIQKEVKNLFAVIGK